MNAKTALVCGNGFEDHINKLNDPRAIAYDARRADSTVGAPEESEEFGDGEIDFDVPSPGDNWDDA